MIHLKSNLTIGFLFPTSNFIISTAFKSLLTNVVYNTSKSKRQTTPKLFRNPILTKNGIFKKKSKSYDYNLPQNLPNRHLYWDRSIINKTLRKNYNKRRLVKLGIQPIHDLQGNRTYQRDSATILRQLANIDLIRSSLGRTFENIRQIIKRFPQESKSQRQIIMFVMRQIHNRFLPSLSLYHFETFCRLSFKLQIIPTEQIMINFYKQVEKSYEMKDNKFKLNNLCNLVNYIFGSREYSLDKYKDNFYQVDIFKNFKLFEDSPPRYRSFEQMIPDLFTQDHIQNILAKEMKEKQQFQKNRILEKLDKIPGGSKLRQKIQNAAQKVQSSSV